MALNLKEVTTMFHLPVSRVNAPQLKQSKLVSAPAKAGMAEEGIFLGVNRHQGIETRVYMPPEDRMRHFYCIGQTGTGKTTLLKNMIIQDIKNGEGVCYIDPHGTDIEDIINAIPPNRIQDVIYFDPSDTARPMGLNMLEYDPMYPEQKSFVINELLSIFNKLFDMKVAGGPMFEQYFRNATSLVIDDPESGNTLLDVSRVLADQEFRELKLSRCKNPIVVQFWRDIAAKAGGESSLANMVPYITNKFDVFLSNEIMRLIVSQEKSAFNFRNVMDERKILLVNLAKGRLGDINSHLIGLILVGKILMAALSRVDVVDHRPPDFYLYIDEFQNITTDSISAILSEARKYRLGLNMAHQFIAQLPESIKNAVFGNVGSMAVFRVGAEDAEFLESQFAPTFTSADMMKIPNYNAYVKMLIDGFPTKPFNIESQRSPVGTIEIGARVKQYSREMYGRDRAELDREVMKKYERTTPARGPVERSIGKPNLAQTRQPRTRPALADSQPKTAIQPHIKQNAVELQTQKRQFPPPDTLHDRGNTPTQTQTSPRLDSNISQSHKSSPPPELNRPTFDRSDILPDRVQRSSASPSFRQQIQPDKIDMANDTSKVPAYGFNDQAINNVSENSNRIPISSPQDRLPARDGVSSDNSIPREELPDHSSAQKEQKTATPRGIKSDPYRENIH
jgi:hypothetical protein